MDLSSKLRKLERDEAWLAEIADAQPSSESLRRVRLAIRHELTARQRRATWVLKPATGAFAAAAMLLLSVLVVRQANLSYRPSPSLLALNVNVPMIVAEQADSTDAELASIELDVGQPAESTQLAMDSGLDDLTVAVEELESEAAHTWSS